MRNRILVVLLLFFLLLITDNTGLQKAAGLLHGVFFYYT